MITIRHYRESDAESVGRLIANTFSQFNLSYASPKDKDLLLGPFRYARSQEKSHQKAIARVIRASMVFVAQDDKEIIGVLRGRKDKLQSLFVRGDYHRQGIGRKLVECFEQECLGQKSTVIRVQATLYAVPFYLKMGYKKSTGVRSARIFEGAGFKYQPMKKIFQSNREAVTLLQKTGIR